jgi:uroporphyrin-III C-methyltransferase
MGVENRSIIAQSLIDNGRPVSQPVAFLVKATTDSQHVVESTLGDVAFGNVEAEAPAVFVIGEVVRLRTEIRETQFEEVPAIP